MKKLPVVMPANRAMMAKRLDAQFPGRLGLLYGPDGQRNPKGLPFALDNGRFAAWEKKKPWKAKDYLLFLDWIATKIDYDPDWAIVPDVVADADRTFEWWDKWTPRVKSYGFKLALAVQNGMTPELVKKLRPKPEVIFVGGTTEWKWQTVRLWCKNFPRVHVGRVNTHKNLWRAHQAGAESTDGTGWRFNKQAAQLVEYLKRSSNGFNDPGGRDNFLGGS